VSDLLSAAFPVPVLRDPDPEMTVAAGAALAVRPQVRRPAPPPGAAPGVPMPAELPARAEMPGVGMLPTDSWPEIAPAGGAAARPTRPPVAVATMPAGGR
jgi:hypothetical protein